MSLIRQLQDLSHGKQHLKVFFYVEYMAASATKHFKLTPASLTTTALHEMILPALIGYRGLTAVFHQISS